MGQSHIVEFLNEAPRKVEILDGRILVGGPADQAPARLERWFRAKQKNALAMTQLRMQASWMFQLVRVSIGDMKSRWGSCSSTGTLGLTGWLLLAPPAGQALCGGA